jgi:hypothetical protein
LATSDTTTRITPITGRASRRDERVRLIEESVLLVRGEWPGVASGLCETVNRAAGVVFPTPKALEDAIRETSSESLRLVEQLYGHEATVEVQQLAARGRDQGHQAREENGRRHRVHLPRRHPRIRAHTS